MTKKQKNNYIRKTHGAPAHKHQKVLATYNWIKQYWNPLGLKQQIINIINNCNNCKKNKAKQYKVYSLFKLFLIFYDLYTIYYKCIVMKYSKIFNFKTTAGLFK